MTAVVVRVVHVFLVVFVELIPFLFLDDGKGFRIVEYVSRQKT